MLEVKIFVACVIYVCLLEKSIPEEILGDRLNYTDTLPKIICMLHNQFMAVLTVL